VSALLRSESLIEIRVLRRQIARLNGNKEIRIPEITVIFRNLVFQNQMGTTSMFE
jgi:hypothetical protein